MFDVWWLAGAVLILVVISMIDIKTKKIPYWGMAILLAVSVLYRICSGQTDVQNILLGCIPGAVLILIALLTSGRMGIGDGLVVVAIGIGIGLERCVYMLMGAFMLCCMTSTILLIMHKAGKNTQIPFVPFITMGMGVMAVVCSSL